MDQQKNLITFCILSILVLTLWAQLTARLFPPKPRPLPAPAPIEPLALTPETWPWKDLSGPRQAIQVARLAAGCIAPMPGVGGAAPLALPLADADLRDLEPAPVAQAAPKAPEPPAVQEEVKEITLGGDSSFITAVVTNRGAGVRQLFLNEFPRADIYGKPVFDADKKPAPLELIPNNPLPQFQTPPSIRLYHYLDPAQDAHPVDALGTAVWHIVEPKEIVAGQSVDRVVFQTKVPGQDVELTKTFTLDPKDYHLGLEIRMKNLGTAKRAFRYQLEGAHGLPIEGEWYTSTFRNAAIGWVDRSRNAWRHLEDAGLISHRGGGDSVPEGQAVDPDILLRYAGVTVQYFASVLCVDDRQEQQDFLQRARATLEAAVPDMKRPYLNDITVRLISKALELPPEGEVSHQYLFYNGPVKVRLLGQLEGAKQVDPALVARYESTLHLNTLVDFRSQNWAGRFSSTIFLTDLIIYCTNGIHWLLWHLHWIIPNYGICIILVTVMVRGLMFPISRKQALTSVKMQALAPEMKKIQEKYKDDPQEKTRAVWELYGKHGVNPMGSCWILLLQLPIFVGLYCALQESIHFRLAPFLWMPNLAAPDMLIWWGENIPFISRPIDQGSMIYLGPFFNLLPVLAVTLQLVQMKMMTPPAMDEQQEMQQKMMKYMMVFFAFMFYKWAAGLCLYFIASTLWSLTERKLLPKAKLATVTTAPPAASGGGGGPKSAPLRPTPKSPQGNGAPLKKLKDLWAEVLREARKK